jgi:hypothetical protein
VERTSVAYRQILFVGGLAHFQHILMDVDNNGVSVQGELGLSNEKSAATSRGALNTH